MNIKAPESLKNIRISKIDILVFASLAALVVLAVTIRLLPLKWGLHLDEFDPYIQYKGAKYIVENGFNAWYTWFDPTRWAPWGSYQGTEGLPGVPFTGAAIYMFLNFLGFSVPLFDVCVYYPVVAGGILIVLAYALGKQLVNRGVGLLTAFIVAVDPTSIQRTSIGFFDTESVGMVCLFLSLIFFAKSLKKRTIPYAIISGISLAYMALAWRTFLYPLNFLALFVILMVMLGKWSKELTTSFTIVTSITLFTLIVTPSYGTGMAISPYTIVPITAFLICMIRSFTEAIPEPVMRKKVSLGVVVGLLVIFGALTLAGAFGNISGKFEGLINPFSRSGIVGTVGENFPSIWTQFFYNYHALVILLPLGVYYALRHKRAEDLFLVLLALTALYGAGSYVRLLILVAPVMALLGGLALSKIMSNVRTVLMQQIDKKSRAAILNKYYGILVIAIVIVAMAPIAYTNLRGADRPAMIVSASTGVNYEIPDWMQALAWMRDNIPQDAIIGTWWDYGYWINVIANKSVVDDNSTSNSTQIALVAEAFLNNETIALRNFKAMNVSYVVVYEPFSIVSQDPLLALPPWQILGDFEKSSAMAVWVNYNSSEYIRSVQLNLGGQVINYPLPAGPKAANCTLYQLLFYPFISGYKQLLNITIYPPEHFQLIYISDNAWVMVYKVIYPA